MPKADSSRLRTARLQCILGFPPAGRPGAADPEHVITASITEKYSEGHPRAQALR